MGVIDVPDGLHDYSGDTLDGVDLIRFSKAPSEVVFAAGQFDNVQILDTVTIRAPAAPIRRPSTEASSTHHSGSSRIGGGGMQM